MLRRSLLPTASSAGWWRSKHTAAALAFSLVLATVLPLCLVGFSALMGLVSLLDVWAGVYSVMGVLGVVGALLG